MRVFFALVFMLAALATLGSKHARAADLPHYEMRGGAAAAPVTRAAPVIVYDFEPGVMARAYFRSPWRNRRYFPTSDQPPVLGRDEVIPGPDREMPEQTQSYYRFWSTSIFVSDELVRRPRDGRDGAPIPGGPEPDEPREPGLGK